MKIMNDKMFVIKVKMIFNSFKHIKYGLTLGFWTQMKNFIVAFLSLMILIMSIMDI